MRRVRGNVEKEGLLLIFLHEADRLLKPNVGAVAVKLLELPVSFIGVVKVVVPPVVGRLPDSAASMPDDILKSAILWAMGRVVTEMPFPDHAGPIAIPGKDVGDGFLIGVQHGPPRTGPIRSGATGMAPRHERGTSRSAEGADVKIGEANRLGEELIDVRSFHHRIAMAGEITVSLIIRHDEDDIGFLSSRNERYEASQQGANNAEGRAFHGIIRVGSWFLMEVTARYVFG